MKNLIIFILLFATISIFAQEIKVKDVKYKFSSGEKFALEVNILSDNLKDVMRVFKKEAEKDAGTIVEKKGELFLDNTIIKSISENKIDVYAVVKKSKKESSKLIACFEINNEYIVPKSAEYKKAEKFMRKLASKISVIVLEKELKKQDKKLTDIVEKIKSKNDRITNLESDIKNKNERIASNKKELKSISSDLKGVTSNINNGKGKLDKLTKQKEKLDKKFEKTSSQISRDKANITDDHKKIEKAKKDIEALEKKQDTQEKVVEKVKKQLADVK